MNMPLILRQQTFIAAVRADCIDVDAILGIIAVLFDNVDGEGSKWLDLVGTPERLGCLLGQLSHESIGLSDVTENVRYRPQRILQIFGKYVKSLGTAKRMSNDPELLLNRVYGHRMGNTAPGEGWKYRGRGYIQLTGKNNYMAFQKALGVTSVDVVANPSIVESSEYAFLSGLWYFSNRKIKGKSLLEYADEGNHAMVTKGINGGHHHLKERTVKSENATAVLNGNTAVIIQPLGKGSKGKLVREIQMYCKACGNYPGKVDGLYGPGTQKAIDVSMGKHTPVITNVEYWQLANAFNITPSDSVHTSVGSNHL